MTLYLIPLISAAIGWFTNFIAVKMLFHPKKEINLVIFKIQGIFPKRQGHLAEKLGDIVSKELISVSELKTQILNTDHGPVLEIVDQKLDDFIGKKLPESMPMLAMFLSDDLKLKIKNTISGEIESMLPEVIEGFTNNLESKVDIKATVRQKVMDFSTDKLEEILYSIMKKEFRFIELLGAILGLLIGVVQVILFKSFD